LKDVAARCIRTRLEYGPDALAFELDAQRAQGLANGGGMMPEIIHDRHPAADTSDFHAPFDALESVEGGLDLVVLKPAMARAGNHGERVAHIEFAEHS